MQHSSLQTRYRRPFRVGHWIMALGFIGLLAFAQQFNLSLSDEERMAGLRLHSSLGLIVLISALVLLVRRLWLREPRPHVALPPVKKAMATLVQLVLYSLAVIIPVSGVFSAVFSDLPTRLFGFFDISQFTQNASLYQQIRRVHELATFLAIAMVLSHGGAALYHHWIKKDGVLYSMLDVQGLTLRARALGAWLLSRPLHKTSRSTDVDDADVLPEERTR